ncbi:MAG TPA: hypothetical protein VM324_02450 [Egibacteraceae bacterium]|nr:hypothetical protein [Egibacteraceae bacterium]
MAGERVRVWLDDDRDAQHLSPAPDDDVVRAWDATTVCGAEGRVRWIPAEHVDGGKACPACLAATDLTPGLEGGHPGPV